MRSSKWRRAEMQDRALAVTVTVLVAGLAIWAFPLSGAASAEAPSGAIASSSPSIIWAYGGISTENVSWPAAHGVYVGTTTYGFSAVLSQTNTSSTTYTLSENQTVGAVINLTYCRPNCASPAMTEQYSYRGWETWSEVANFTRAASVTVDGGTSVGAVGLLGSNATTASNITEKLTTVRTGKTALVKELFASASAQVALSFTPALALYPLALAANATWVSSAAFAARGTWASEFLAVDSLGPLGPDSASGSLSGSGVATLHGADRGPLLVLDRNLAQVSLRLGVLPTLGSTAFRSGFDLMDGFAILPHVATLLQSGPAPSWGARAAGNTTATSSLTDLRLGSGNAPASFAAASWSYSTAISNPDPSSSGGSNTVQGAPITPAQASSTSNCLEGTVSCGTSSSGPVGPGLIAGGRLSAVFTAVGILAIVAIAGGLLVSRRRRIPPPVYPNATLYPPGRSAGEPGDGPEPEGTEPPDDEDDPLRNLW